MHTVKTTLAVTERIRPVLSALVALALLIPAAVAGETPRIKFEEGRISELKWGKNDLAGETGFELERLVFSKPDPENKNLFGRAFEDVDVGEPRVEVRAGENRIIHHYPWGRAEVKATPSPDALALELTIANESERMIADFRAKLMELEYPELQPEFHYGEMRVMLDKPHHYKTRIRDGHLFLTYESFDPPVLFGLSNRHGRFGKKHDILLLGGAPGVEAGTMAIPQLGQPRVPPGQSVTLKVMLRFGGKHAPDASVLGPYYRAYYDNQAPHLSWPDRRPIGRIELPSSPPFVSPKNPRGWFYSPTMDIHTEAGRQQLREKTMELADTCIERMEEIDAQGMVVWNIEGGHFYADAPYGDPRKLEKIAPEMDAVADDFFARFRDEGLRTGVCIRPSLLHFSPQRQRWSHGAGYYDPEHESYPSLPTDARARNIYPLTERLSAKIEYARERWGCTLFYIHDNGYWWAPARDRFEEWLLIDGRVLRRLRQMHPDVLLIPHYAERHMRPMKSAPLLKTHEERGWNPNASSLRGAGEFRISGLSTPEWIVVNSYRYKRVRTNVRTRNAFPTLREHVLRQAYWANAAPYVEMKLYEETRDFVLTLEQHMEYTREQAEEMAEEEIPFETTPDRIREWISQGITVCDIGGAEVGKRKSDLTQASAWGDILMWDATSEPKDIALIFRGSRGKRLRIEKAARLAGIFDRPEDAPLTPISTAWQTGIPIDPAVIVQERPIPGALRVRAAVAPDRKSALLMCAWRGHLGQSVRLKPGLPGLDGLQGEAAAWQIDSGASFHTSDSLDVGPDPIAGMSTVVLRAGQARPAPRPRGVLVGADFDKGIEPTLGGGLPLDPGLNGPAKAARTTGGALLLDGQGEAWYNVVPDWYDGTVEFDIKAPGAFKGTVPVLRFGHHLDLRLDLEQRKGVVGLALTSKEENYAPDVPKKKRRRRRRGGGIDPRQREQRKSGPYTQKAWAPLAGPGAWHHVVLLWEVGQYVLYVDGKRAGEATHPVLVQSRDATVYEPGVILGGTGKAAGPPALLDSLVVYDWPFAEKEAQQRRNRAAAAEPLLRKGGDPITIWVWGGFPDLADVAVNARRMRLHNRIKTFEIQLYERFVGGRRQVAYAEVGAQGGVALASLKYKWQKVPESEGGLSSVGGAGVGVSGGGSDDGLGLDGGMGGGMDEGLGGMEGTDALTGQMMEEMNETLDMGKPYSIVITPHPKETSPGGSIRIDLSAGEKSQDRHRW